MYNRPYRKSRFTVTSGDISINPAGGVTLTNVDGFDKLAVKMPTERVPRSL